MSSVKTNTAAKNPNYWVPEHDEVTDREKFISKAKKDPFVPIGFVGLLGALGYGVYAYKTRGPAMTTSRYLMRLRVIAQSMVVGSIILGVGITQLNKEKR
ncbi:HIG1 domain family member 1A, mitochondrial-like [Hydractinia symbiolongicarpus]|uniref:HIG1 domain family member 1A, mitochondrial-like n=1 Tax=Hydractinia symbiolongicarpus TaxID=13093 RepID=UPI00254DF447|nr:HIG1 domain family member 1A, mitochondrial-like [Hydractinia symbiolongicarpus]